MKALICALRERTALLPHETCQLRRILLRSEDRSSFWPCTVSTCWLCCLVQAALDNVAGGRTTIAIAHRLTTIVNSDMIAVVDQVGPDRVYSTHNAISS